MSDHREHSTSFPVSLVARGRSKLGAGTALVDEDVLRLLLLDSPSGEKVLQISYESIAGVGLTAGAVMISMRDGVALTLASPQAPELRTRLLSACRALPEVTRALRALGSRRTLRGTRRNPTDKERRFFAPLIAARRASMEAREATAVVKSFDAERLIRDITAVVLDFAAEGGGSQPARRRALEAELTDASEQLTATLQELAAASMRPLNDVDDLATWRAWAAAVQRAFEAADRSWAEIEPIVNR
jgi:hypothetical protein